MSERFTHPQSEQVKDAAATICCGAVQRLLASLESGTTNPADYDKTYVCAFSTECQNACNYFEPSLFDDGK